MMRKRMDVRRALPAVALLCLAAQSTVSWAQSTDPTSGDVVIFPAPKELEYTPRQTKPKFAVPGAKADEAAGQSTPMSKATGLHLPGNHFRAGEITSLPGKPMLSLGWHLDRPLLWMP